jgi:hypothetical protein
MQNPVGYSSTPAAESAAKIEVRSSMPASTAWSYVTKRIAEAVIRYAARCFHGIGGLALLHSTLLVMGVNLGAVIGLGVTTTLAARSGNDSIVLVLISNGWMAGLFFLCGLFAERKERWAFVLGMLVYSLDGMLLVYARVLPAVGLHALMVYVLYRGLKNLPRPAATAQKSRAAAAGVKKAA